MRARLIDPMGPAWLRLAIPAACVAMTIASMLVHSASLFFFAAALLFLAPFLATTRAAREVTLELHAGRVDVRDAGVLAQSIRARNVKAASTARVVRGVGLALVRDGRDGRPTMLEVETESDAAKLRDALGVGHFGFGALSWPRAPTGLETFSLGLRLLCGAFMSVAAFTSLGGALPEGFALPVTATLFGGFIVAVVFVHRLLEPSALRMTETRLGVTTPRGWQDGPYSALTDVALTKRGVRIDLEEGPAIEVPLAGSRFLRTSMSDDERVHVVAQIRSAVQRSHGEGAPPPRVSEHVADLAKRGEPARAWLSRLDAVAERLAGDTGYRGVGFDEADLWATLGDHDAPGDLRAGAARVLVRIAKDHTEERVASVLQTVRDADSREKIRVALDDDFDRASEELDALDQATKPRTR